MGLQWKRVVACLGLVAILAGCVAPIADLPQSNLNPRTNENLSDFYYLATHAPIILYPLSERARSQLEEEMKERGMSTKDLNLVREGNLEPGMSELAVRAVWGEPLDVQVIRSTEGMQTKWVYGAPGSADSREAVFEEGLAVAFTY